MACKENTRYSQNRSGSLSLSSRENLALLLFLSFDHCFAMVVLPNPAGAERLRSLKMELLQY